MTPPTATRDDLLAERDLELDVVGRALHHAAAGRGRALLVEAPAGMGKTALLAAARSAAEENGFRWLRARCSEREQQFAFGVLRQLIEPTLADASDAERASLLDGPPAVAARLLGLPGARDEGAPAPPDPTFAILHGLYWLCANLAADHPVVLAVDDLHWADDASRRFIGYLLRRVEDLPILMLLAARPAEGVRPDEVEMATADPALGSIILRPLTIEAVTSMIAVGLGVEPEPAFAEACRNATGGTPFLVEQLVAALREEGLGPVAASIGTVDNLAIASVGRWGLARLARLGPEAAALARAVAVLERAELDEAAALAGLSPREAARPAESLVLAGILEERPLAFAHPLLRAGVYGAMSPSERSDAHGRAARLLAERHQGAARVAEHLLAAAPAGDPWVVDRLSAAARDATGRGGPESAAVYLRRALAEPPAPAAAGSTLRDLGLAEFVAGWDGWEGHLEAAVDAASDDEARLTAAMPLALALGFHQRFQEAAELCDRVAALVDEGDAETRMLLETNAVACGVQDAATAPSMAQRADALVALADEVPVPRHTLAVAAYRAGSANQPADRVADLARRAVAAGPRLPDPREAPWFSGAVIALIWTGRYDEAQALLDAAVSEARATANGLMLPGVLAQRALLAHERGDLSAAEADARSLLEDPDLRTALIYRLPATSALVSVLIERGELDEAERVIEPLAAELERPTKIAASLRYHRGRVLHARLRFGEALRDFLAVGEVASATGSLSPSYVPWRGDAALVQLTLGERDEARRLSEEELELARAFGAPRVLGVALRVAGIVAGGAHGEELLREAIDVLDGPDSRLPQAHAQADLGALLRRSNRRVEARELLRQAVDTAHRAGARPLASRAETELRATGARPRRVLLTGLESLTASELRIAELAALGLTNREIAQKLFVTSRTVEGHLTNVFSKLDVSARTELPDALGQTAPPARD